MDLDDMYIGSSNLNSLSHYLAKISKKEDKLSETFLDGIKMNCMRSLRDFDFGKDNDDPFYQRLSQRDKEMIACEFKKEEDYMRWVKQYVTRNIKSYAIREEKHLRDPLNVGETVLSTLDVTYHPNSRIMPTIKAHCPNLEDFALGFKEITSQDFENCFSNMSSLEWLSIHWVCEKTLPMTLAKSIEQIGGWLKHFVLACALEFDIFLPDLMAPVFPRLIALETLYIWKYALSQLLLQSIGEMKNLSDLQLVSRWPKNHPMSDTKIDMYPIGNLENLESLLIDCDYGITDEFLINLCNNAKKLITLYIFGKNITDTGMAAINNLKKLEDFDLGLTYSSYIQRSVTNEFITDESIQCLRNQELKKLNISNCINVTGKSVLELVKNLPKLKEYSIKNTKITPEDLREIYRAERKRDEPIEVHDD
ncbi:uncharacterized protein LOC122858260 [Aphidius gifuensis]|uniref:uncharacterized protein LOC122858260 n=1 Tax=Aphidius gifuensis TaxID=684658 RepID=UPI001CDB5393|nr:uncharacterized protein LOC122858260 [Aphidius gifuensis]